MMPVASLSSPSLALAPQPLRALRRGRTLAASPRLSTHHRHVRMARARAGEQTVARREAGLQVVSKPASPLMDIPVPAVECDQSPAQDAGTTARSAVLSAAAVLALVGLSTQPALADAVDAMEPIMDAVSEQGSLQEGFLSAFLLIFFSEIGDKTFFIAVLLALQKPKSAVFAGTFGALAIMTCISVALGEVLHLADEALHDSLPPALADQPLDDYAAVLLLVIFGVQTILGAKESGDAADEEREEAEEDVEKLTKSAPGGADLLPLILSTFALVFAAEWGDKSFLATIALAAAASPVGVVTGAIAGHGVATGVAVSGGSLLSEYVSQELVSYAGGGLFLVFAGATVLDIIGKTT